MRSRNGTKLVVPCPGCSKPVTLRRAAWTADPGLAASPWAVPFHRPFRPDNIHQVRCDGVGVRYSRTDPMVTELHR